MIKNKNAKKKFFEKEGGSPKKVLLVGLGILGGGTAMAKFVLDEGGELAITDLRNRELLQKEIQEVEKYQDKLNKKNKSEEKVIFHLEKHDEEMFKNSDVVLFNPAVPYFSKWPQYCLENKIPFFNDFTLFQEYIYQNGRGKVKQIWITGTRGKSTTTAFVHQLLGGEKDGAIIGGNVLGNGLQKISKEIKNKKTKYFVLETSNFQLEYPILNKEIKEPDVAIITNIFVDHLNRHKTIEEYRRVKKLIFSYNENTRLFLNKKEGSVKDIWENKIHKNIEFITHTPGGVYKKLSPSQETSLDFAISVAKHFGIKDKEIGKRIKNLKAPQMRQEIVFENKKWKIINDSCATSPDALIASINNFKDAHFISGGTDAELDFADVVKLIKKKKLVKGGRMVFLKGTATDTLSKDLDIHESDVFDDLEKAVLFLKNKLEMESKKDKKQKTIILSPGAKSFGLFKNEYDRGEKFNKIVKKHFKGIVLK